MSLLLLLACPPAPDTSPAADTDSGAPAWAEPEWDAAPEPLPCNEGEAAPLYDAALADAEISRDNMGFAESIWSSLARAGYVRGPFQWPSFEPVHHEPEYAACWVRQHAADLDAAGAAAHPVAAALGVLAATAGVPAEGEPVQPDDTSLASALDELADAAGGGDDGDRADELPEELAEALVLIVRALTEGIDARHRMDAASEGVAKPQRLFRDGASMVLSATDNQPSYTDPEATTVYTDWFTSDDGPRALLGPARKLAFAIEDADLQRFAGGDTSWSFDTDAGRILISPSTDDLHDASTGAVLLAIDLGGNDTYLDGVGANADEDNPVAVNVDLGGDDTYGYTPVPDDHDTEGLLPSDIRGREPAYGGYWTSSSITSRQGSGRYGIGLAFDLGAGNDTWASLRLSQGFGSLGVGVLADDGGDDTYAAEAGAQGSGVFGYGLLLDGGGNDTYLSWAFSQGFGYTGGIGQLLDVAGDDTFVADPGNAFGGTTLYYSPQLPGGEGNSSFCQGAGFGFRGDQWSTWFSGGVGSLRDVAGNDSYVAGVFSQATGYWEGTGILADGAGNDTYDALYYMQGGSAHFASALFFDGGGDDQYSQTFDSQYMHTGAGHDYSLGLFLEDAGNDVYAYNGLAAGASNCQGVGVFVDKDGSDTYTARSTYSTGLGNHSGECETRTSTPSIGIFLDGGGDPDVYLWPEDELRTPADDSTFGIEWNSTDDEHGGAADGSEVTGF